MYIIGDNIMFNILKNGATPLDFWELMDKIEKENPKVASKVGKVTEHKEVHKSLAQAYTFGRINQLKNMIESMQKEVIETSKKELKDMEKDK